MNWQERADALNSLAEMSVRIRKPNDWYVRQRVSIGGDGFLTGICGNGTTPEEAVENHWFKLVDDLSASKYLVVTDMNSNRKNWRWNGYMWREISP